MLARLRKAMDEKDEGFTLIELLVVIIIIGILAAIAIPVFLNQRKKGYEATAKSDLKNAATAQETYLTDYDSYTTSTANLITAGYKQSANITFAVVSVRNTSDSFCMSAVNDKGGSTWYYDSAASGGTANVSKTACT
jgi:type IV pilus assembly protein PilA